MTITPAPGQCLRVVPSRLAPGALEGWLKAHREIHSPGVQQQPGFILKLLLQSESDPEQVAMLLLWETAEQAVAWTKLPLHDEVSAPMRPFTMREGGPQTALPRGGYRLLDAVSR
jgi:heme-degrading monooxygenase HmoA